MQEVQEECKRLWGIDDWDRVHSAQANADTLDALHLNRTTIQYRVCQARAQTPTAARRLPATDAVFAHRHVGRHSIAGGSSPTTVPTCAVSAVSAVTMVVQRPAFCCCVIVFCKTHADRSLRCRRGISEAASRSRGAYTPEGFVFCKDHIEWLLLHRLWK